jgi:hypothetical protein
MLPMIVAAPDQQSTLVPHDLAADHEIYLLKTFRRIDATQPVVPNIGDIAGRQLRRRSPACVVIVRYLAECLRAQLDGRFGPPICVRPPLGIVLDPIRRIGHHQMRLLATNAVRTSAAEVASPHSNRCPPITHLIARDRDCLGGQRGASWRRSAGKPLRMDGVPGTTEAARQPRNAKVKLRVRQFQRLSRIDWLFLPQRRCLIHTMTAPLNSKSVDHLRPPCSKCSRPLMLTRFEPEEPGFGLRVYYCAACEASETIIAPV